MDAKQHQEHQEHIEGGFFYNLCPQCKVEINSVTTSPTGVKLAFVENGKLIADPARKLAEVYKIEMSISSTFEHGLSVPIRTTEVCISGDIAGDSLESVLDSAIRYLEGIKKNGQV